ncbi:MAG: DUF2309 domain-containing protein [Bacteriovoracaceae bacterium]|nr:DUF2309 domain-containing protein [Bacteriovoracaceae bacterium]
MKDKLHLETINMKDSNELVEGNLNDFVLKSFNEASSKLSPLWDTRDYVAVNPFFGQRNDKFLNVANYLEDVSGTNILPKKDFFKRKYEAGEISDYDLEVGLRLWERESGEEKQLSHQDLLDYIENTTSRKSEKRTLNCVSDLFDLENNSKCSDLITNEISRWASAYFDEGQALWKVSTEGKTLYSWWKSLAKYEDPFKKENSDFLAIIKALPHEAEHALAVLTEKLLKYTSLNSNELSNYYFRLITTIMGWSSYIKKFEFEAGRTGDSSQLDKVGGLIDILAIRMTYDLALLRDNLEFKYILAPLNSQKKDFDFAYIWLNAVESSYRRKVESKISENQVSQDLSKVPMVQMAFCIDVRSEILRRKLEKSSDNIQTIGFAGFFGMPISIKKLGHEHGDQNCPILLNSVFEIGEKSSGQESALKERKKEFVNNQIFRKQVQSSANSGFSFVETLGFSYIPKMIFNGLGRKRPNIDFSLLGLTPKDKRKVKIDSSSLSLENKVTMSWNALKNMGLTKAFGKYVFFIGHGSESSNNPYASALDCGACAGHNGEGNAELLATLLNQKEVREELEKKGISIPNETLFFSGWHNTTSDKINIREPEELRDENKEELMKIYQSFEKASEDCRLERSTKFPTCSDLLATELKKEFEEKASNWSEIRPEWGLARNASFIVGRRDLTKNVDLEGRAFLHDYNFHEDQDLSILELIMTAPMVVTNWINMQYYASTVNQKRYGAGNKVLNNVVGGIGCLEGNGGDLLGGLTEQSVWYKGDYFHEPIRLQVYIEAETSAINQIIEKHLLVKELISNNWLKVIAINPNTKKFKLYQTDKWIETTEDLWN